MEVILIDKYQIVQIVDRQVHSKKIMQCSILIAFTDYFDIGNPENVCITSIY